MTKYSMFWEGRSHGQRNLRVLVGLAGLGTVFALQLTGFTASWPQSIPCESSASSTEISPLAEIDLGP